jgi:hypothetical protein
MEARLREKGAVKDMESMFDDIKEEATQTKLTGTDKDKKTAAKAVCDKRQGRCRLGVQHHAILQRDRRLQLHRDDPIHCCSIVIGGGEGKGGKVKAGKKDAGVNPIANTDLTTWVPPTSTPAEVRQRQYHRELHEKLDVLPFADGLASSTRINAGGSGSGVVNSSLKQLKQHPFPQRTNQSPA